MAGLAESHAALGRAQAASANFRRAMEISKSPQAVAARAGWALLQFHLEQDALQFLDAARVAGGDPVGIDFNRGIALYRSGLVEEAREAWKAAAAAGSPKAVSCLRDMARRSRRPAALLDYWFGPDSTRSRKIGGGVLVAAASAAAVLPVLKLAAVPWIQAAPWTAVSSPALVVLSLLLLPSLSSLKLGPFEFKPAPLEPAHPLPRPSIEAVIDQALSSRAVLMQPVSVSVPHESVEARMFGAVGSASSVLLPSRPTRSDPE